MNRVILITAFLAALAGGRATAADSPAGGASRRAIEVRSLREWQLPAALRWAFDVRWGPERTIVLAAGKAGVVAFSTNDGPQKTKALVRGGSGNGEFFFSVRMGLSERLQIVGSPFGAFSWRTPSVAAGIAGTHPFAVLVDADVHDGRFALLGADRDGEGVWSPDGTIVWTGTIGTAGPTLRALMRATGEPNAMAMARCHILEMGAVRFTPGGDLLVVPGVEPGIFLYGRDGRLRHTWRTDTLGFTDRCPFDDATFTSIMASAAMRHSWWNDNIVLDELLTLGGDPALILRRWDGRNVRWELVRLARDRAPLRVALPFTSSSPFTHLRADLRGDDLVVLLSDYTASDEPSAPGPRVIVARLAEGTAP